MSGFFGSGPPLRADPSRPIEGLGGKLASETKVREENVSPGSLRLVAGDLGRLDQFPELGILLKRLVLRHFQSGTEKEILQGMAIKDAMDHQAEFMALEINTVIADAEPVQGAASAFQLAELVQFRVHHLLRQT